MLSTTEDGAGVRLISRNEKDLTRQFPAVAHAGQERKRFSNQRHETNHTGRKVANETGATKTEGKRAVVRAKKQTPSVSRKEVEDRAKKIAE
jgi:hypothetical protein